MDQERPSRPVPGKEAIFFKQIGIDLGSRFAAQLGFDGIEAHVEDPAAAGESAKKKKKKKPRKKKKKPETEAQPPVSLSKIEYGDMDEDDAEYES